MEDTRLQAWWFHRQGLDGSMEGMSPEKVLAAAGWARSVGGVGPYLTLFARAGTSREDADAAVALLSIHELPAARGCTYVVPAADFGIALAVGRSFADADMRTAAKLSVTEKEIDRLSNAVLKALSRGPLDPDGIREAVGDACRNLGEEGKKKGLTTTLPVALGRLQAEGRIRRVPVNGRLDQQRYRYTLWDPAPVLPETEEESFRELARRYFRWVGPATFEEFRWFSGLGVKTARQILDPLHLEPAEKEGDRLLLPEDRDAFRSFKAPSRPAYALVGSLDSITAARRNVRTLLRPEDLETKVRLDEKVGTLGGLADLPSHAILDRGRLVGLWEFDPEAGAIVWGTFGKVTRTCEAAVLRTEEFVREQLGDARSFSLDTPKSRRPRIEALQKMG